MEKEVFVLWGIVGPLIGTLIGQNKGRIAAGALFGLLLGPIGWAIVALGPNLKPKCPECGGVVVPGARKCKNCGSRIPRCPACNRQLGLKRSSKCKHCGEQLTGDEWATTRPSKEAKS